MFVFVSLLIVILCLRRTLHEHNLNTLLKRSPNQKTQSALLIVALVTASLADPVPVADPHHSHGGSHHGGYRVAHHGGGHHGGHHGGGHHGGGHHGGHHRG